MLMRMSLHAQATWNIIAVQLDVRMIGEGITIIMMMMMRFGRLEVHV